MIICILNIISQSSVDVSTSNQDNDIEASSTFDFSHIQMRLMGMICHQSCLLMFNYPTVSKNIITQAVALHRYRYAAQFAALEATKKHNVMNQRAYIKKSKLRKFKEGEKCSSASEIVKAWCLF